MLRAGSRRLAASLASPFRHTNSASSVSIISKNTQIDDVTAAPKDPRSNHGSSLFSHHLHLMSRGFASSSITPTFEDKVPPTVAAITNPTSKIVYDEHNHERYPPGDPSKRAFAYFVLTGGRFVYASLIRLLVLKFVLSMSASKDVLALASIEVDLSSIEPGTTVTVKWRGKPVFIRRRTDDDVKLANSVDISTLRDPQEDAARVKNPEWLVVVGVCTHLGCIPLPNAGDFGGCFAHVMVLIMTSLAGSVRVQHPIIWRCRLTASWRITSCSLDEGGLKT